MRRVSSLESGRGVPAGASFPLISTSGGRPGEKNRSLTFAEVFNIEASSSGVEMGAAAGAAAAAARMGAEGTGAGAEGERAGAGADADADADADAGTALGGRFAGDDIET